MNEMTIDLRSDTVTKPTPEMRAAIANADVGDDVIDGQRQVRAVLLGGADRQHHGVHAAPGQRADLFPGQLMPAQQRQNTLSTSSCTGTMRTMFR